MVPTIQVAVPDRPNPSRHTRSDPAVVRIVAVVSAANRLGVAAIANSMRQQLGDRADLTVRIVGSSDEATSASRAGAEFADIVVAVGGDGTVADVATGIFDSQAALAIVPAGSTNITARSLGIPREPAAAVNLLISHHIRRLVDVGRCGDRSFVHIAGAGFDAELFRSANPVWKRRLGWLAYIPAAAEAIRLPPSQIRVTIDGAVIETTSLFVLIANGGSAIVPEFRIYPGITIDDGLLDVLVFTSTTAFQIAHTLGDASRQRLDRSPHVIRRRGRDIVIEATPNMLVQLDGDPLGPTPRAFHVAPARLQVITPEAPIGR